MSRSVLSFMNPWVRRPAFFTAVGGAASQVF
jgi:hypothetical protein